MANRFLDRTNKTGDLTGSWTFTNGSSNVTAPGADGNALAELAAGDYVKPDGTNEWYMVSSVTDDDNFVISTNFAQATQSSVTANYADVSVNDGTTAGKAFVHFCQFTEDEVRSAGDVLYCRRNQTHIIESKNIDPDEAGSISSFIKVMGDDGTGWVGETGYSDPVIDFNYASHKWNQTVSYWHFKDLEICQGSESRLMDLYGGVWIVENCLFHSISAAFGNVLCWANPNYIWFNNCTFHTNTNGGAGALVRGMGAPSELHFKDCSFYNAALYGIHDSSSAAWYLEDCVFGTPTQNQYDVGPNTLGYFINCDFNSTNKFHYNQGWGAVGLFIMDYDDTKNSNKAIYRNGVVDRVTSPVRSSGADTSIQCEPLAYADDLNDYDNYFVMYETWIFNGGTEKTYSLYMRATGTWSSLPSNTELYLEASYFDSPSDAGRSEAVSTDTISVEDTWTQFSVTCTPARAGPVRLRAILKKYESGKKIIIDPLIVIS